MFQLLFLLSAIAGTVVAIHPAAATGRLILIVVGLALSVGAARLPATPGTRRFGRILFAALPVLVALYFLLTNDWLARIGKLPALDPVLRLLDVLQPIRGLSINTNVIGGVIAAYLPLQIAALRPSLRKPSLAWLLIGFSLAVLLASLSRSAWLAVAGVGFAALVWRGLAGMSSLSRRRWLWLGLMGVTLILFAVLLAVTGPGQRLVASTLAERGNIWRDSFQLALDYPFTGLGLTGFEDVYSAYMLLVHVPFLYYAHNLFLDVWLGQGLLGLVAFVGWIIVAVATNQRAETGDGRRETVDPSVFRPPSPLSASWWRTAALASLGIIVVHGLLDDPWYGYGAIALPLLFVPLGLLARRATDEFTAPASTFLQRNTIELRLVGIAILIFAAGLVVRFPTMQAAAMVNQAAIQQQRAELQTYSAERFGMQDAVRRKIDLQPVVAQYEAALQIDSNNAAARRRLGQIDLAHSELARACAYFREAWAINPDNRATRQFMGECAALDGDAATAARFWRSVDLNQGQLQLRYAWYNDFIADPLHAVLISAATNSLK